MKRIKSLPSSLRPREKLLKTSSEALSLEELIAVILITGNKKQTVSQLANKIAKLLSKNPIVFKQDLDFLQLGPSKTAQLLAALELSQRLSPKPATSLTSAEQVFAQSYEIINQDKESLLCFYLNARGEVLKKEIIAVGTLNKVNLLPREIFSLIKELPVASIILVHNHPSGALEPSKEDILFTKRVKASADILGISLLDHLIVTKSGYKKIIL